MKNSPYTYVMYISTSPEKLWNALIDPKVTAKYWQHDDGLASIGSCGRRYGGLYGVKSASFDRSTVPRHPTKQDLRIITAKEEAAS